MGDLANLGAAIGTGAAVLTSLGTAYWTMRRTSAETAKMQSEISTGAQKALAETAAALAASSRAEIKEVRAEVERVRRERDELRSEVSRLWAYVGELTGLMRAAGLQVPPMRPPARAHEDA